MKNPRPGPKEILLMLAADLNFDALREKYPLISDKTLRDLLNKAAGMCPEMEIVPQKQDVASEASDGRWIAYIDGASRGNPGPAGVGVYIHGPDANLELTRALGRQTNNVAEYEALLLAMNAAADNGVEELEIRSDSELLVKQMNGVYRVKNQALSRRFSMAKNLEKKFRSFNIVHVRRENNCDADRLANKAIDEAEGSRP